MMPQLSQQRSFGSDNSERTESLISHKKLDLTLEQQLQKMASPYAIRNLTDKKIKVHILDRHGNMTKECAEIVDPDQVKKLIHIDTKRSAQKS